MRSEANTSCPNKTVGDIYDAFGDLTMLKKLGAVPAKAKEMAIFFRGPSKKAQSYLENKKLDMSCHFYMLCLFQKWNLDKFSKTSINIIFSHHSDIQLNLIEITPFYWVKGRREWHHTALMIVETQSSYSQFSHFLASYSSRFNLLTQPMAKL